MPFKKRYPRKKKRFRRRKKRTNHYQTAGYQLGGTMGLPRQRVVRIRYQGNQTITSTAGALATAFWRANSAFDPSTAGAGDVNHTPIMFTKMSEFYDHYCVLGSKAVVTWTNAVAQTAGDPPAYAGIFVTDDTTITPTRSDQIIEQGRGSYAMVGSGNLNSYQTTRSIAYYSAKKFHGVKDPQDNPDLRARVTADPTENAFYTCWVAAVGNGTVDLQCNITIDYIVMFNEPKDL